jgi:hypothetical protein
MFRMRVGLLGLCRDLQLCDMTMRKASTSSVVAEVAVVQALLPRTAYA